MAFNSPYIVLVVPLSITRVPHHHSGFYRMKLVSIHYPFKNAPVTTGHLIIQVHNAMPHAFFDTDSGHHMNYSWSIPFSFDVEKGVFMWDSASAGSDSLVFDQTTTPTLRFKYFFVYDGDPLADLDHRHTAFQVQGQQYAAFEFLVCSES